MTWQIRIDSIGGIASGSASIEPGLNAVRGSNWQGKSSFVEAIKVGLGVSKELMEGADEGQVRIDTPDETYTVDLVRENGTVVRNGTPVLADEYDVARMELFGCLDERNAIRDAVRQGDSLEDSLLQPLDFQRIDEKISDLKRERERVESERKKAQQARNRLPKVQEEVTQLESELSELNEKRKQLSSDVTDQDTDSSSAREELSQARSDRNQAENQIDRLERTIQRAEEKLAEYEAELEEISVDEDADVTAELAEVRDTVDRLEQENEVLQSVYSANEMVLAENKVDLIADVERGLVDDSLECWTCGERVTRGQIEERLDRLGQKISEKRAQVDDRRKRIDKLEARREEIKQTKRRKSDLKTNISELQAKLSDRRQSLSDARDRLEAAEERIEQLSDQVDTTLEEITDIEGEIKYRKAELQDKEGKLEQIEQRAQRADTLEDEYEEISSEIEELRSRKEEIKRGTRDAFDEAVGDLVERLNTGFESARLTSSFELVVARDGRETPLDALSEGELELLGIVAGLAGHEAFDTTEVAPIMVLDGIGSLADENLHALVEYIEQRTDYFVFTTFPEHSPFDGQEIDPSEWEVGTPERASST
ncbi:chromosome segregation ATPase [Halalkaliarchaeum desulfuricum]|uniref:Chromosome segregation ATPase n=1 Tax=Halalkaliarchaeum desulfuricum TaxID=2055893 RepID=A0A343TM25_9EURY|nr:archaea-specific SMC-related protein [Halalkaliarchaeum desulfuricum]AUX10147.1 chromosome segregation ATPase [Halalkaliarchaeum desulfuricum]